MADVMTMQLNQRALDLFRAGRFAEAEGLVRQVLARDPRNSPALLGLGMIAQRAGKLEDAVALMRQAINVDPAVAEYHYNISEPLRLLNRLDEAASELREAIRLRPAMAEAHMNLGAVYALQHKLDEAVAEFRITIQVRPGDPNGYTNLAKILRWQEKLDEAIAALRQAIVIAPNFAIAFNMLGSALRAAGRIDEAIPAFRKALALNPNYREAHSSLVYGMHFDPDADPKEVFAEHLRWAQRYAEPLRPTILPHLNDCSPDRRLRIGYVSPDLRNHVIGLFMEPILAWHDHARYEVFCYADIRDSDDVTRRLQSHADTWRMTAGMSDEKLAEQVREDKIDVLIDLTLHMRGSRLLTFARKPAPVQITHLAYCASSGLSTMDWCITDPHLDPPELGNDLHTEKLLRLPECYWCYQPWPNSPDVSSLPALDRGYITFGSLNSLAKVNPRVIDVWRQVLEAVPQSRLSIHAYGGEENQSARQLLVSRGIPGNLLELHGYKPSSEYLAQYHGIDIALDPFPYGGGTTSLDALWMGMPLITLAGRTAVARTGVTLLKNLGLPELIARTPEEYVAIAAGLANDLPRLTELRANLRGRLQNSPLMDVERYVRNLEEAYRSAWREWCVSKGS